MKQKLKSKSNNILKQFEMNKSLSVDSFNSFKFNQNIMNSNKLDSKIHLLEFNFIDLKFRIDFSQFNNYKLTVKSFGGLIW